MTHESLARKLRVLRAARGITLAEAEELTGVTRETLGALEHGQRGAYTSTLQKIAEGYGTTVSALLEEEAAVPLAEAPPQETGLTYQLEQPAESWRGAVEQARRLREVGRERMEGTLFAWRDSVERENSSDIQGGHLEEMLALLQEVYDAEAALGAAIFRAWSEPRIDPDRLRYLQFEYGKVAHLNGELRYLLRSASIRVKEKEPEETKEPEEYARPVALEPASY
jgi:transcriptional regulator with XRE-family HTH domain